MKARVPMKAHVECGFGAYGRIKRFLQNQGFTVKDGLQVGRKTSLVFSGERDKVITALTDLKYKFPVGYVSGWTL